MDGPASRSVIQSRQLSQQGVAALERGQWDRADELLAEAVRACPSNPDARRSYADARWNRGQRKEAIAELETARRLAPDNAAIHVRLAEMQLAMGQTETGLKSAQRAIDLEPKLASAWVVRAQIMRAAGNPSQALADALRAVSYAPDDRTIPCQVAAFYLELNQPQRALAIVQGLADRYSPGDEPQEVMYYQGLSYLALARYDDAAESLTAAARERPTAEILCRLAQAQWAAGRAAEALAAAEKATALDPKHQPTRQFLAQIQTARQAGGPQRR